MKKKTILITAAILITAISTAIFYSTQTATTNQLPTQPPPNWQIKTTGDTENPQALSINDLAKMPLTDVIVKSENATYRGVSLLDFADKTGARWDAGPFTITGELGQNVTINIYQAYNSTTYQYNHSYNSIVLAFIKNGNWLSTQEGGPVKLIAPSLGSDCQVRQITEVKSQPWIVRVTGNVAAPLALVRQNLTVFQAQTIRGEFRPGDDRNRTSDWTGIAISDLLTAAHASSGASAVSIIGIDNYTKTFTLEQLEAGKMMLGYQENREPLPVSEGGPFRLFAPTDTYKWGQNWVKYVTEIRVT